MTEHQFSVVDYIDLVDRLTALLNIENDLLDTDPTMIDDGSDYAAADKAELQDAVSALNQAVAENERALRAAIRSTDRLVKAVVLATSEARGGRDSRYTAAGTTGARKRSLNLRAVDQML
jgi:hypothetical protein